jgi:cytochrome c oxidase assembly factor 6
MGLFSSSKTPSQPTATTDGAFEAPDRSRRAVCWEARDAFFACLDAHNIIDSVSRPEDREAAEKVCGGQERDLRRDCAESWVTYFKKRRIVEHRKASMLEGLKKEGAKPMPEGMNLPGMATPSKGT